ncbi:hypothetical protein PMIN01_10558 [Paraphaeosphaeria minitans]|uniref:Uncharacterized protein n=1 Tax=Paraphaeosphaeria minitans TaxID=565426 RepID=A0A9P6G9B7_9PLEO|nr:hypothetical protein PMIN01_10558 [Paraphaeosphaeria minitans]
MRNIMRSVRRTYFSSEGSSWADRRWGRHDRTPRLGGFPLSHRTDRSSLAKRLNSGPLDLIVHFTLHLALSSWEPPPDPSPFTVGCALLTSMFLDAPSTSTSSRAKSSQVESSRVESHPRVQDRRPSFRAAVQVRRLAASFDDVWQLSRTGGAQAKCEGFAIASRSYQVLNIPCASHTNSAATNAVRLHFAGARVVLALDRPLLLDLPRPAR